MSAHFSPWSIVTLVIGGLDPSAQAVPLSVGGVIVVGIVLAVLVLRARFSRGGDAVVTMPAGWGSPGAQVPQAPRVDGTLAMAPDEPIPPASTSSGTDSTVGGVSIPAPVPRPSPPIRPPDPCSAIEPAIALTAPGAELLGRLRRRPLAERVAVHPLRSAASSPTTRSTKSSAKVKAQATPVSPKKKKATAGSGRASGGGSRTAKRAGSVRKAAEK